MGRPQNGKAQPTVNGTKPGNLRTKPASRTTVTSSRSRPSPQEGGGMKGNLGSGKPLTDRSQLNFPYDVRLNGYSSIHNAVTNGTPRVKRILMEECDFILECRVCRNLFRSLPNFITHKLNYCKKAFDSTWCIGLSNLIQTSDVTYNIEYEVDPSLLIEEDSSCSKDLNNTRSVSDLYNEIAEKAQKRTATPEQGQSPTNNSNDNCVQLQLKPLVDTTKGSVVLQQRVTSDTSNCDINSKYTNPLDTAKRDTAILGPNGKVIYTGTNKGIDRIVSKLYSRMRTCVKCKTVFANEKLLNNHNENNPKCGDFYKHRKVETGSKNTGKPEIVTSCVANTHHHGIIPSTSTGILQSHRLSCTPSTSKVKRSLVLSPAKRIKLKYANCNSNSPPSVASRKEETKKLSCGRCSLSFSTMHEMSMHLAMCTGVINYAFLKDNQSPVEKIRISSRNCFVKVKDPVGLQNDLPRCNVVPVKPSKRLSKEISQIFQKPKKIRKEIFPKEVNQMIAEKLDPVNVTNGIPEVNNNKEYNLSNSNINQENENNDTANCQVDKRQISLESTCSANLNTESSVPNSDSDSYSETIGIENNSNLILSSVNNKEVSAKLRIKPISQPTKKVKPSPKANGKSDSDKNNKGGESVSLESNVIIKPQPKVFNLRKAVKSRIRKSSRATVVARIRLFESGRSKLNKDNKIFVTAKNEKTKEKDHRLKDRE